MSSEPAAPTSPMKGPGKGLFAGLSVVQSEEDTPKVTNRVMVEPSAVAPLQPSFREEENSPAADRVPALSSSVSTTPSWPSNVSEGGSPMTGKLVETKTSVKPSSANAATADNDSAMTTPPSSPPRKSTSSSQPTAAPVTEKEAARHAKSDEEQSTPTEDKSSTKSSNKAASPAKHSVSFTTPPAAEAPAATNRASTVPRASRGMRVHSDTPIPNADKSMHLLRKFASKTRPKISQQYRGAKSLGVLRYFRSKPKDDPTFVPFRNLMNLLLEDDEDLPDHRPNNSVDLHEEMADADNNESTGERKLATTEDERVIELMMGASGDTMAKARRSVAAFCHLLSVWGHASSRIFELQDKASQLAFAELLSLAMDSAAELVSHGCLDGVKISMTAVSPDEDDSSNHNDEDDTEYYFAINMLAESVLVADITVERSELAAMKFMLSAGCRVVPGDQALLRGTHLLQTIRMLYHIYLTTDSESNRTTARASLQQMVTSIFARLVRTRLEDAVPSAAGAGQAKDDNHVPPGNNFPSENHRDAFLVLRSICKLSMRNLPDANMHSHVGLQTSGSNAMWDGTKLENSSHSSQGLERVGPDPAPRTSQQQKEQPHLVYTHAIHPAMESKILALELLHYVLHNVKFTPQFVHSSGIQFHSAIRNYLCVSLLKNCTSDNTKVVNLSLRMFALLVRNFRTILKNEVEAFVTNVFFVILDSKNSPIEHKSLVVTLFEEICSDPHTLAEIFLNYDCDLSAVDLFHRIVNTLSRVARSSTPEPKTGGTISFVAGVGAARMEKLRNEHRELRLDAMRALRQVLASLHASIVEPLKNNESNNIADAGGAAFRQSNSDDKSVGDDGIFTPDRPAAGEPSKQNLVQIYDSKKKRRQEESEVVLRFNQKPSAGISYAAKCGHIVGDDPADVARYLLKNKDLFEKTQIGEFLGREPEYQNGFSLKVLHDYVRMMDFSGLQFDDAIRYYLSGFRLPGEAQKIDRIMEKFAERYTDQNPDVFPTADVAFILAFSIIMLNTDLHNPAIKEERRMTKEGFIRNNSGICDGQDLPEELLLGIFDRIKENPISLKEDDEAREKVGQSTAGTRGVASLPALSPAAFFSSHYDDMDRTRETNFQKERDHIVRTTESLLKRRRHPSHTDGSKKNSGLSRTSAHGKSGRPHSKFVCTEDSGLRDEYVSPMFEVTWGPALAAFSTAMESANGTVGALENIATEDELELAAENAAETIEVCLTGFKFAIGTAGLCGNDTARDAFMFALSRFTQLGTGVLLEPRHVRCIQTLLSLGRDDGELLGSSWEHIFKALAEVNRFHQLFQLMARNDRAAAAARERRRKRLADREQKLREREVRRSDSSVESDDFESSSDSEWSESQNSLGESSLFSDDDDFLFVEDMDTKAIDEANARVVYEAVSEALIDAIYQRSSSLSGPAVKEFIFQLCRVSRLEISVKGYCGHAGSKANTVDLNQVQYRQKHSLLQESGNTVDQFHHSQPNIYSLQKLVEVTHYNMESRPRLVFAEIWTAVSNHLTSTALHANPAVAMYAVDSFRQLCIQFLQRGESEGFEVQRRFLTPLENVMSRSEHVSTKELLLKCVERIVLVFGHDGVQNEAGGRRRGNLRSGWVTILHILRIAGGDLNETVAKMGFEMLRDQVNKSITEVQQEDEHSTSILSDHFVGVVDALLTYVGSEHESLSIAAIDQLVTLCDYLGDKRKPLPQIRRKNAHSSPRKDSDRNGGNIQDDGGEDLAHWWPVLLGLSRSVGHSNISVRSKALLGIMQISERHFLSPAKDQAGDSNASKIQTLRLIFRGILTPMLEYAEMASNSHPPPLPEDFDAFLTGESAVASDFEEHSEGSWLDTTFDQFIDGCVSICLSSITKFSDDSVIEEIFAILNNCLLSDSGALAVRGIKRLRQFVMDELAPKHVTDDTWATVSHMLRRCLTVQGLPKAKHSSVVANGESHTDEHAVSEEEQIREFVHEDSVLPERRYVASNTALVIGSFLSDERFRDAISIKWRLFLISGLGRGIRDWEHAASILKPSAAKEANGDILPPDYLETAVYGRKWMNRLIQLLIVVEDVANAPPEGDATDKYVAAQHVVVDQTQRLLNAYIENEKASKNGSREAKLVNEQMTGLVLDFLTQLNRLDSQTLERLVWLSPVFKTWGTKSKNQSIIEAVNYFLQKASTEKSVEEGTRGADIEHESRDWCAFD